MRVIVMGIGLTLGAVIMDAVVQEKKDEPPKKETPKREPAKLDEKVSIRVWLDNQKEFGKATELNGKFFEGKNKQSDFYIVAGKEAWGVLGHPTKGSEITDKDGKVWVVDIVRNGGSSKESGPRFVCEVKAKP